MQWFGSCCSWDWFSSHLHQCYPRIFPLILLALLLIYTSISGKRIRIHIYNRDLSLFAISIGIKTICIASLNLGYWNRGCFQFFWKQKENVLYKPVIFSACLFSLWCTINKKRTDNCKIRRHRIVVTLHSYKSDPLMLFKLLNSLKSENTTTWPSSIGN